MGIPCDPAMHQQPTDFARLFPLHLEDYQTAFDDKDVGLDITENRIIFYIWYEHSHRQILYWQKVGSTPDEIVEDLVREMEVQAIQLGYYFGSLREARYRIDDIKDLSRWFRVTAGCFDLETGNLIDPDRAALREFESRRANR